MTVLARDEADVLDAQLAFHWHAGVDCFVATDHRSRDETRAILERWEGAGRLRLISEQAQAFDQSAWVTRMARIAATELGADWVIHADADEFWWPRSGDLEEVLAATPPRYGVLRAPIRHFFLRPGRGHHFSERMIFRPLLSAPVNQPESPLRPNTHVLHRADANAVVTAGNHALRNTAHVQLQGWHPIEVLHFPLRSAEQARRKYGNWVHSLAGREYRDAFEAQARGELEEYVEAQMLRDDVLERGLAEGSLVEDVRVRDALRALAGTAPLPENPGAGAFDSGTRLEFPHLSVADEAAYAAEVSVLEEADAVRLQRRLDEAELRLARLERRRLRYAVSRLVRRA